MNDPNDRLDMDMDDVIGGGPQGEWGAEEDDQYDRWKEQEDTAGDLNSVLMDIARAGF